MSRMDKWIHCTHAQAWVPEHTVGGLFSHTVSYSNTRSSWDCRPWEARLGKLGGGLQGPRDHEGLFRVLMR